MNHLRVVAPRDRTDEVLAVLREDHSTANLTVVRGAAIDPPGDVVTCDLAREGVNGVLERLRDLGIHRDGSLALEHIAVSISDVAARAEERTPGFGADAAVWEEVDARVRDDSYPTPSFLVFIVLAALIAAVGLIEDSTILIVGAMVLGPEFGPIAGLAVGLFKRRGPRIRLALGTLGVGFVAGAVAACIGTVLADTAGIVPEFVSPHDQPVTGFVVDPSLLGVGVAFLAGIAGMLSLTEARAGALIGVLISVTTIPADAAIGVSAAYGEWGDVGQAAIVLGSNVLALVVASLLTLWVQREAWERVLARRPRARRST